LIGFRDELIRGAKEAMRSGKLPLQLDDPRMISLEELERSSIYFPPVKGADEGPSSRPSTGSSF
jgi:hypothetical protein